MPWELESEEQYVCLCAVFNEIRGRYHRFFKQGFGLLAREWNKEVYGTVLSRTQEAWREVVQGQNTVTTAHQERNIMTFCSSLAFVDAAIQSMAAQVGSSLGHSNGLH